MKTRSLYIQAESKIEDVWAEFTALTRLDFFFSPAQFVESLPLFPLSVSLNASLIAFDFFQIISFRLPLLILKPPSLTQRSSLPLSNGSVFLSFSLTSSKCTQYWCFFLPCDAFPPFSSPLCLPPFICQRFSVVFSPQVYSLSCTQTYRYTRGFTEFLKAETNTDFCSETADGQCTCQYKIYIKMTIFLLNKWIIKMSSPMKVAIY